VAAVTAGSLVVGPWPGSGRVAGSDRRDRSRSAEQALADVVTALRTAARDVDDNELSAELTDDADVWALRLGTKRALAKCEASLARMRS
jgi:hypothetical protein